MKMFELLYVYCVSLSIYFTTNFLDRKSKFVCSRYPSLKFKRKMTPLPCGIKLILRKHIQIFRAQDPYFSSIFQAQDPSFLQFLGPETLKNICVPGSSPLKIFYFIIRGNPPYSLTHSTLLHSLIPYLNFI